MSKKPRHLFSVLRDAAQKNFGQKRMDESLQELARIVDELTIMQEALQSTDYFSVFVKMSFTMPTGLRSPDDPDMTERDSAEFRSLLEQWHKNNSTLDGQIANMEAGEVTMHDHFKKLAQLTYIYPEDPADGISTLSNYRRFMKEKYERSDPALFRNIMANAIRITESFIFYRIHILEKLRTAINDIYEAPESVNETPETLMGRLDFLDETAIKLRGFLISLQGVRAGLGCTPKRLHAMNRGTDPAP